MKKVSISLTVLLLLVSTLHAQIITLYPFSTRCMFLKGKLELGIHMRYFDHGSDEQYLPHTTGYSIDANLTKDSKGKKYMKLVFYEYGHHTTNNEMNINLYFKNMPDTITFYLNIVEFKPGVKRNVIIRLGKKSLKKLNIIDTGDRFKKTAYDITDVVFTEQKKE